MVTLTESSLESIAERVFPPHSKNFIGGYILNENLRKKDLSGHGNIPIEVGTLGFESLYMNADPRLGALNTGIVHNKNMTMITVQYVPTLTGDTTLTLIGTYNAQNAGYGDQNLGTGTGFAL